MSEVNLSSTPENEGRGSWAQESRRMTPIEFLRLLLRQCEASDISNPSTDADYASNNAYGQIATWIRLWVVEDREDREKTQEAKNRALETILTDERRKFDDADKLIAHIFKMTAQPPSFMMENAMWKAVHLFCSDYMTRESVRVGKNLFIEKE